MRVVPASAGGRRGGSVGERAAGSGRAAAPVACAAFRRRRPRWSRLGPLSRCCGANKAAGTGGPVRYQPPGPPPAYLTCSTMEASLPKAMPHSSSRVMTADPSFTTTRLLFSRSDRCEGILRCKALVLSEACSDEAVSSLRACTSLRHIALVFDIMGLYQRFNITTQLTAATREWEYAPLINGTIREIITNSKNKFMAQQKNQRSQTQEFEAGPWRIVMKKSHILKSECEKGAAVGCPPQEEMCTVCRYTYIQHST